MAAATVETSWGSIIKEVKGMVKTSAGVQVLCVLATRSGELDKFSYEVVGTGLMLSFVQECGIVASLTTWLGEKAVEISPKSPKDPNRRKSRLTKRRLENEHERDSQRRKRRSTRIKNLTKLTKNVSDSTVEAARLTKNKLASPKMNKPGAHDTSSDKGDSDASVEIESMDNSCDDNSMSKRHKPHKEDDPPKKPTQSRTVARSMSEVRASTNEISHVSVDSENHSAVGTRTGVSSGLALPDVGSLGEEKQNAESVHEVLVGGSELAERIKEDNSKTGEIPHHVTGKGESEGNFPCKLCSFECSSKSSLAEHVKKEHKKGTPEKPFSCSECSLFFARFNTLKDHVAKVHRKERNFLCNACGAKFFQKIQLKTHMLTHIEDDQKRSELKPFSCSYCNQKFTTSKAKKYHELRHSDEKPYLCNQCGSRFRGQCDLSRHIRAHSGLKLYHCKECNMKLATAYSLQNHIKMHERKKKKKQKAIRQRTTVSTSSKEKSLSSDQVKIATGSASLIPPCTSNLASGLPVSGYNTLVVGSLKPPFMTPFSTVAAGEFDMGPPLPQVPRATGLPHASVAAVNLPLSWFDGSHLLGDSNVSNLLPQSTNSVPTIANPPLLFNTGLQLPLPRSSLPESTYISTSVPPLPRIPIPLTQLSQSIPVPTSLFACLPIPAFPLNPSIGTIQPSSFPGPVSVVPPVSLSLPLLNIPVPTQSISALDQHPTIEASIFLPPSTTNAPTPISSFYSLGNESVPRFPHSKSPLTSPLTELRPIKETNLVRLTHKSTSASELANQLMSSLLPLSLRTGRFCSLPSPLIGAAGLQSVSVVSYDPSESPKPLLISEGSSAAPIELGESLGDAADTANAGAVNDPSVTEGGDDAYTERLYSFVEDAGSRDVREIPASDVERYLAEHA